MTKIEPHPRWPDPVESERCPDCGGAGRLVGEIHAGAAILQLWGCPACESGAFPPEQPGGSDGER